MRGTGLPESLKSPPPSVSSLLTRPATRTAYVKLIAGRLGRAYRTRTMHDLSMLAADGGDSGRPVRHRGALVQAGGEFGVRDSQYNFASSSRAVSACSRISSPLMFGSRSSRRRAIRLGDQARRGRTRLLAGSTGDGQGRRGQLPSAHALHDSNNVALPVVVGATHAPPPSPPPSLSFSQRPKVSML